MPHTLIAAAVSLSVLLTLQGCCSSCRDPETAALIETLSVAGAIGSARHLTHWLQVDLDAAAEIPEAEKADLRARAQILAAHADAVSDALDRFDAAGETNKSITLHNLKTRASALDAEYQDAFREWAVWQVRNGRKKPAEVSEFVDLRELVIGQDR